MTKADEKQRREQRSAAKLRENLKRRKEQQRARSAAVPDVGQLSGKAPDTGKTS
jgi:hypothetical protein